MEDEIGGSCGMHRSKKKHEVLVMKPECKTPFTRPKRMWEDNFKMHLKEIW
jgi:hypothetical protein